MRKMTLTGQWDSQAREQNVFEENNEEWFSPGYLLQHEPCSLTWSTSNRALQLFLKWKNKKEGDTYHGHEGFWNGKESGISQAPVLAKVKELYGKERPLFLAVTSRTYLLAIKLVPDKITDKSGILVPELYFCGMTAVVPTLLSKDGKRTGKEGGEGINLKQIKDCCISEKCVKLFSPEWPLSSLS